MKSEIVRTSSSLGFKVDCKKSFYNILLDYLTVRLKIIPPRSRKILLNPLFAFELQKHPKRKEIEHIINLAAEGKDLNMFQSKRLFQTNFHDHLQNEWNVFHFHLSLKKEKKSKFIKQVDALLFAYVDEHYMIFLGTDIHKEGIFGDIKWIEILHDFFPHVIEEYKDSTITSIYPRVNALERQTLWNKGYTLGMTEIRGKVYHSPGIGRSLSGHGFPVTGTADEIIRWIHIMKEQVTNCYVNMLQLVKKMQNSRSALVNQL